MTALIVTIVALALFAAAVIWVAEWAETPTIAEQVRRALDTSIYDEEVPR